MMKFNNTTNVLTTFSVLILFSIASLVLFLETHFLIPYLSELTSVEPVIYWFLVAGLGMFLPLFFIALYLLRLEGFSLNRSVWTQRLRFRKMSRKDWTWSIAAVIIIGAVSYPVMYVIELYTQFDRQPPFMSLEPLTPDRYWILLVWLPYWILNIMGEEVLWRGVILPGQEKALSKRAWLINGAGWTIFHLSFGWQLLITMIPILFILPYVVQKTGNSWTGVIIHAAINGPSFIAIAFGLM